MHTVLSRQFPLFVGMVQSDPQRCFKRLNKSGVLQELDEHLIDKFVLGYGLDHKHSLLPQVSQHHRDVHFFIVLQAPNHQFC